jgi:hypothetical protein
MFEVAGAFAYDEAHNVKLDQKVIFVKNPACPYDPNAIEVYVKGKMIGYVPRTINQNFDSKTGRIVFVGRHVKLGVDNGPRIVIET